jgi:tetratricopeptide (TPR) repeat protein
MKDMKSFYQGIILLAAFIGCSCIIGQKIYDFRIDNQNYSGNVVDTDYGSFLAAQHALYVNDFDAAEKMLESVDRDINSIKQTKDLTDFLNGKLPGNVDYLKDSKDLSSKLMYDAYLLGKDDWKKLYKRYEKNDSVFLAPLRIFSAVHEGKKQDAMKYVDSLKTNDSWKAFVRGQIAVLNNDIKTAAKEFADVHPEFMNINDYLYLMSFYQENEMFEDMDILREDFLAKPGGMYVMNFEEIPDWSNYTGYKNNLVFSIIQNVSHTQLMIFTDLSLLILKFASVVAPDANQDAINYYLGQYYFYNSGDYKQSFNAIDKQSPLYLFGQMKIAERTGDINALKRIVYKNPLFLPAIKTVIANDIQNGNKRSALRIINRALRQKNITDDGRVFFLKHRANVYLMFNQPKKAQKDLNRIQNIDDRLLSDILLLQARIWAAQNKHLDDAYDYAMTLVKRNTSDVEAWDIMGVIVEKREGIEAALEVLERVGEISMTTSSLYEHLGDIYKRKGDKESARRSYMRALDLSDDGLVVVPFVQKKLRRLR